MKQAAIYVFLLAGALWFPEYGYSQEKNKEVPLWPLMMYASLDNRTYHEKTGSESNLNQQYIGYAGATLKPVSRAWFHIGASSRYTKASGINSLYIEPASAKLATGITVLRKLLYISAGLRLPLIALKADTSDFDSFSYILNGYSILSQPNILPLNSVHLGGYVSRTLGPVRVKFGMTYIRATFHTVIANTGDFPAPILNYRLETDWKTANRYHRVEAKLSSFSPERDRANRDNPAHTEGLFYQLRYGIRFHIGPGGLETAAGLAIKGKDESRRQSIDEVVSYQNNLQRGYFEFSWFQPHLNNSLIHGRLTPQILFRNTINTFNGEKMGSEMGVQNELHVSYKFKTISNKFLKVSASALYGFIGDETLLGGGLKVSYTFHRLRENVPRIFPARGEK